MVKKGPVQPRFGPNYLRRWRRHRKLTLEQLAELVDVSHPTIQRIETRKQPLGQPILDDLATVLRTTRGSLLDRPPNDDD